MPNHFPFLLPHCSKQVPFPPPVLLHNRLRRPPLRCRGLIISFVPCVVEILQMQTQHLRIDAEITSQKSHSFPSSPAFCFHVPCSALRFSFPHSQERDRVFSFAFGEFLGLLAPFRAWVTLPGPFT